MKTDVTIVCVCHSREKGNAEKKKKKIYLVCPEILGENDEYLG